MARLLIRREGLHLSLSGWDQLGAIHADIRVPFSHIIKTEIAEKPWRILSGIRAPGFGIPRFIMLGTMRAKRKKDFCAIYQDRNAVVVYLRDETFDRLIVTCAESEKIVRRVNKNIHTS
jgi:hypothetical protein